MCAGGLKWELCPDTPGRERRKVGCGYGKKRDECFRVTFRMWGSRANKGECRGLPGIPVGMQTHKPQVISVTRWTFVVELLPLVMVNDGPSTSQGVWSWVGFPENTHTHTGV